MSSTNIYAVGTGVSRRQTIITGGMPSNSRFGVRAASIYDSGGACPLPSPVSGFETSMEAPPSGKQGKPLSRQPSLIHEDINDMIDPFSLGIVPIASIAER